MKKILKELKNRMMLIFTSLLIVGVCSYLLHQHYLRRTMGFTNDWVYTLESKILDAKIRMRGPVKPKNKIGILAIDEKSILKFGEWPFSRKYYAGALRNLKNLGVKQVGYDIIFSDPQSTTLRDLADKYPSLKSFQAGTAQTRSNASMGSQSSLTAELSRWSKESLTDTMLASAIHETGFSVLGYYLLVTAADAETEYGKQKALYFKGFDYMGENTVGFDAPEGRELDSYINLMKASAINTNVAEVSKAGKHFSFFTNSPDDDAINRWVTLVANVNGQLMPSLSLKMAANHLEAEPIVFFDDLGVSGVSLINENDESKTIEIATDPEGSGRVLLNTLGPSKTFKHFSLADAYFNTFSEAEKKELKGASLILAGTAKGTNDQRPNAFDPAIDGAENHAAALDNILSQNFLKRNVEIYSVERWQVLLCGLVFAPLFIWGASYVSALTMLLFVCGFLFFDWQYWFIGKGVWSYVFFPCFEVFTLFITTMLIKFFTEEREKRKVKGAFSHYLSPDVIEQVLDDPDALALGGQRCEITTFFSDVRGFTTISESLSPEQLVIYMNEYFNPMTAIVMKSGGTLDKYIGDAIMAFWGAPVKLPRHAEHAADSAIRMLYALDILQQKMVAKGFPKPDIGIGLNTGAASVGNMGSDVRFSYTAMGDSVNLASRLEGLTKSYHIKILISEFTAAKLSKSNFFFRDLDDIRVKGKNEPVRVFELMRPDFLKDFNKIGAFIQRFESGREHYRAQQWNEAQKAFKDCLTERLDDYPSQLYLERCQEFAQNPPQIDKAVGGWDGVYNFTHK